MKTNYNLFKLTLYVSLFLVSFVHSQTGNNEPRFSTFHTGQAFTSITADANKNVWAGTTSQGIFFMDQTQQTPTFSAQALGTSPVIGTTRMTSMARDRSGNIWIAHEGINSTGGIGGIEKVNVNSLAVQHFGPGINARGFTVYNEGDGLPTRRVQQIVVDPNNKVWTAHRFHDVTSSPDYIVTPGSISSRMADVDGPFTNYSTWNDWQTRNSGGIMLERLPYPAYTYNPPITVTPDSRTVNAISVDRGFIYISVFGYNDSNGVFSSTGNLVPTTYLKPRILKYTNEERPQFVKEYTTQQAMFSTQNGIFNGVYANKKGVWATTPVAGNGFSVLKNGQWRNITDSSIMPPGTAFNRVAIWGDSDGRVYLGTNNGLIVYDGVGDVFSANSYTHFSKTFYNSYRSVHDPDMLSNNITAGCVESEDTKSFSWIATPAGIMRCNLPLGDFFVYHVENKDFPNKEKIDGRDNYTKFTVLKNSINTSFVEPENDPSFAADGTKSSVLRLKTDDPGGYYAPNSPYRIVLRKDTSDELPGDRNDPDYIAKYGKFTLKPISDYEGQPLVQDLKFVDFIYQHPTYINSDHFDEVNKHSASYQLFVFKSVPNATDDLVFRHFVKLSLPPVLFGHGVWSYVNMLKGYEDSNGSYINGFEKFFQTKGYTEYETSVAWRLDKMKKENHFSQDAHIIPNYIKSLISKALDAKVSAGKVNVIVHSRGGLYARAYIEEIEQNIQYNNDINSLVTLNTPHFGSQGANVTLDKRIIIPSIRVSNPVIYQYPLVNLSDISTFESDPIRIKDIVNMLDIVPEEDRENPFHGAKNLMVENDILSGAIDQTTRFVPTLNSSSNLQKLSRVPMHYVSTTFNLCELSPSPCNFATNFDPTEPLPLRIFAPRIASMYLLYKTTKALINSGVNIGLDIYFNQYLYQEPNDGAVPERSMRGGLNNQFISTFSHLNIAHSNLEERVSNPQNIVVYNTEIQESIFGKLKQEFSNQNSNFTKPNNIPVYTPLKYDLLPNFQGFRQRLNSTQENNSKILIHPSSFTPTLTSGSNISFEVYQENNDEILIYVFSKNDPSFGFYMEKSSNLEFKNTFSLNIPSNLIGKFTFKAFGFNDGEMTSMHEIEKIVEVPSNITLQSIRFEEQRIEISERNQHRFKLLGLFSDSVEREINDLAGVTYTIEFPTIIALPNLEIVRTDIPGQSKLTASVNGLTAVAEYVVLEDIALNQTIIADYYADFEQTGPIDLKWKSLLEYNSNEFTLESSTDNVNFTQINQQNALGTSYDVVNYGYSDSTTENFIYYRLKAFDTFNNVVFEETILVDRNALSNPEFNLEKRFTIYPNPVVSNNFSIKIDNRINTFSLKIYDITGNLILEQDDLSPKNSGNFEIQLPNKLSEGIYLVQIKTNEFIRTEKLIIQN